MKYRAFKDLMIIFCSIMLIGLSGCAPSSSTSDGTAPSDNPTLLANLIKTSNLDIDGFDVTVDNSDPNSPKLRIAAGLVNKISGDPVRITIDIDQTQGITTTPASLTVVATKFISPDEVMSDLMVTFGEEAPVSYTVITVIGGAPVNDWFAGDNLSNYAAATFGSQGGTFSITGTTLSIAGFTNSPTGDGEITFTLPEGFTATPDSITLPNPDGTGETTSTPTPNSFTITETGNTENSMAYSIADVPLAALTRFAPGLHVKITEGDSTPPGTDITSTLAISGIVRTEDGSNVIRIEGLTNKAGLGNYTLTIAEVDGLFTTPGNTPITRTIAEPHGTSGEFDFSPGTDGAITDPMDDSSAPTFALINSGENEATIYTLEVVFSGAPVSDWFTATDLSKYIMRVGFAGIAANSIMLNEAMKQIVIGGDSNFANEPGEEALFDINFPRGFDLNTSAIMSPPGDSFAAVTNASIGTITISERDNPNNSEEYSVTITLAAYNSPLTGNITATYGGMAATSITIETTNITVLGFTNDDTATPESGTVMITEAMIRTGYTVTPLSLAITDPSGKAVTNVLLGTITVTNTRTMREIPHPVAVRFDGDIQLRIEGTEITGTPLANVDPGTTIAITTGACELLAAPTITIVGFPRGKIADATPFPRYYDRDRDTLDTMTSKRTVARKLTLEDVDTAGNTSILTSEFIIKLEFPECTTFAVGTGDSGTPYEIDNAPRLDLMSHLVISDRGTYGDKEYKLMGNIDMGLAGFPRSEVGSKHPHEMGATGKGFYPIGIGSVLNDSFSGTLDCASKRISGLYINRLTNGVGLVGNASNATIKNCILTDVNITGGPDTGGLAGYSATNSTISNSSVTGGSVTQVSFPGSSQNSNAGGLVAFLGYSSSVSDSYADVTLSGEGSSVGGLVGQVYRSAISNSYAIANVTGMSVTVGGLVGSMGESTIISSYAIGSVTGTSTNEMGTNFGGLVGEMDTSSIKDSYARVNVTGMSANVGGLVGLNYSGTITNVYATGNVSGTGDNVGLFIGLNSDGSSPTGTGVTSSYFSTDATLTVGDAVQTDKKGVGSDTTGASPVTTANVTGRTTDQLRVSAIVPTGAASVYVDWDKDSMGMVLSEQVWNFTQNQYPRLINVVCANRQDNQDAAACTSPLP
ncbi:hypothetical protein COTS27_00859 [Spirochaetota bacterium]|nr:hypothetical protein COTS27_00859 [Spirochaetota bacterium]